MMLACGPHGSFGCMWPVHSCRLLLLLLQRRFCCYYTVLVLLVLLLLLLHRAAAAPAAAAMCAPQKVPTGATAWAPAPACSAASGVQSGTICTAACAADYVGTGFEYTCTDGTWAPTGGKTGCTKCRCRVLLRRIGAVGRRQALPAESWWLVWAAACTLSLCRTRCCWGPAA
jgi:hypothetical protein